MVITAPAGLKTKTCAVDGHDDLITKAYKMYYIPQRNQLIAGFSGAKGIHSFDLRADVKQLAYYNFHYYPITDFDIGGDALQDYAVTAGATQKLRYDVRPINFQKSKRDNN